GDTRARSLISWVVSARALASVVPSRNRATPMNVNRLDAVARVDWVAIQASVRTSGNVKEAGITPTTVVGSPSTVSDRPTMAGSRPKRRIHSPCESTTGGGLPGTPSWSVNQRPKAGWTRSTDTSDGVARDI